MSKRDIIQNVSLNIAKGRFLKRFEQMLIDLPNFSTNGHFKETVRKFRTCLIYNEAMGEGALPFLSKTLFSRKKNKDNCVLCFLSATILRFWEMQQGNMDLEDGVDVAVATLEGYAAGHKRDYLVTGKFPKYYLEYK